MNPESYPDTHHDTSSNVIFGFWLYLMTDFIMFATFFAAFAVLQGSGPKEFFSLPFALAQTLILLLSSFSCALASLALARHDKKGLYSWYSATFLLGASFLALMIYDLNHFTHSKSAFLGSYFSLIGLHGIHIALGLFFMIFFLLQVSVRGLIPVTIRRLTCLKMFWFFSYIVWIFMFTIIYLIGAS